jgi:AraC family transcriptional regulator
MPALGTQTPSPWLPIAYGSTESVAREVAAFRVSDLSFPPGLELGVHRHRSEVLSVVLDGAVDEASPDGDIAVTPATAVVIPAGLPHADRFHGSGARAITVEVDGARRDSRAARSLFAALNVVRATQLSHLAHRLANELRATDPGAPLATEGLVLELLATASRSANEPSTTAPPPAWLATVEDLLTRGFRAPLRIADIARAVNVHPAHLSRVFRAHKGVSLAAHVRRLRLDWAANQLAMGDSPLAALAADAGFADQSHFTNAFKRHTGLTPARYRALTRPSPAGSTPFGDGPAIRDDRGRDTIPPVLFWK